MTDSLFGAAGWPRTAPPPLLQALLRVEPEDFVVEEQMPYVPEGRGEHGARTGVRLRVGVEGEVTSAGVVAERTGQELAAVPPHKAKGPLAPRGRRESDRATSPISCTASVPKRSAKACTHSSGASVTP